MEVFARLRRMRQFEKRHMPFLESFEDLDLVLLIGQHQMHGQPITMKRIASFGIGAPATLQRRVARLKRLGVIEPTPLALDKRNVTLELNSRIQRVFQRYERLLAADDQAGRSDALE